MNHRFHVICAFTIFFTSLNFVASRPPERIIMGKGTYFNVNERLNGMGLPNDPWGNMKRWVSYTIKDKGEGRTMCYMAVNDFGNMPKSDIHSPMPDVGTRSFYARCPAILGTQDFLEIAKEGFDDVVARYNDQEQLQMNASTNQPVVAAAPSTQKISNMRKKIKPLNLQR